MQRRFAVLFTWCPYLLTESFALLIRMGMFGVHPIPCVINREVFFFVFCSWATSCATCPGWMQELLEVFADAGLEN